MDNLIRASEMGHCIMALCHRAITVLIFAVVSIIYLWQILLGDTEEWRYLLLDTANSLIG